MQITGIRPLLGVVHRSQCQKMTINAWNNHIAPSTSMSASTVVCKHPRKLQRVSAYAVIASIFCCRDMGARGIARCSVLFVDLNVSTLVTVFFSLYSEPREQLVCVQASVDGSVTYFVWVSWSERRLLEATGLFLYSVSSGVAQCGLSTKYIVCSVRSTLRK